MFSVFHTGMAVHNSCDTEVNLCYSSPCGGNGTCVSKEGSFHCICVEGFAGEWISITLRLSSWRKLWVHTFFSWFTGSQCEIDLRTSGCYDTLCKSPSVCTAGLGGRVECVGCPADGHHTPSCQLTTRSFSSAQRSYIVFPGIKSRNRFGFSLRSVSFPPPPHFQCFSNTRKLDNF